MNSNSKLTEAILIEGCLKGDRKSQKTLYDKYAPKLFSLCLRYTKSYKDAEDVLQDGFIKLFNNLEKFKGDGSFEGWIRRIFVNTAIQHFRNRKLQTVGCEQFENVIVDTKPCGLDNLYYKDLLKKWQSLSRGYKTVFHLYAVEGYSHQEIAQVMGISESTSKSQYLRARGFLRTTILGKDGQVDQQQVLRDAV
jgi:RNA polymerase sigma factor (sigma-70 family)